MRKSMIALGLMAVMLFGVTYVYAQGAGFGQGHKEMHNQRSWGPGQDNPLTPEQKAKLQDLRRKFTEDNAQLIGAIVAKRLELRSLWTDPKADPNTILQKEKELRGFQDQMKDKSVQAKLEARKFLTPEQISNWRPGRGMGRGFGGGPMMGRGHGMGPGRGMGHGMCY